MGLDEDDYINETAENQPQNLTTKIEKDFIQVKDDFLAVNMKTLDVVVSEIYNPVIQDIDTTQDDNERFLQI